MAFGEVGNLLHERPIVQGGDHSGLLRHGLDDIFAGKPGVELHMDQRPEFAQIMACQTIRVKVAHANAVFGQGQCNTVVHAEARLHFVHGLKVHQVADHDPRDVRGEVRQVVRGEPARAQGAHGVDRAVRAGAAGVGLVDDAEPCDRGLA